MLERVKSRPEPSGEKHSCRQHFNDRLSLFDDAKVELKGNRKRE